MLRVEVYCSLLSSPGQVKLVNVGSRSLGSWQNQQRSTQRLPKGISVKAVKDGMGGETSGFRGQSWEPESEIAVPFEQRPVNEYSSLKEGTLYSWGDLGPGPFFLRIGGLWLVTFTVLGAPIAAASFNPSRVLQKLARSIYVSILELYSHGKPNNTKESKTCYYTIIGRMILGGAYDYSILLYPPSIPNLQDPLRFVLAAGTGTLFLVSLIVLRIYLGWSYVGDRLLSAVIPYEETGWYDGQMWVKPPEVLARDRLLGSYKVKPVIKLLKQTLVGTGVLLVSAVMLFIFATPVEDFIQTKFSTKENSSSVSVSKMRRDDLLKLPMEVKSDDDLAAAAAEAADGRPVYCRDRFYRALAGGQYCKSDDLLMK